jgi:hypothetical protein
VLKFEISNQEAGKERSFLVATHQHRKTAPIRRLRVERGEFPASKKTDSEGELRGVSDYMPSG